MGQLVFTVRFLRRRSNASLIVITTPLFKKYFKGSWLNYVPYVPSCLTCLHALRALIFTRLNYACCAPYLLFPYLYNISITGNFIYIYIYDTYIYIYDTYIYIYIYTYIYIYIYHINDTHRRYSIKLEFLA